MGKYININNIDCVKYKQSNLGGKWGELQAKGNKFFKALNLLRRKSSNFSLIKDFSVSFKFTKEIYSKN